MMVIRVQTLRRMTLYLLEKFKHLISYQPYSWGCFCGWFRIAQGKLMNFVLRFIKRGKTYFLLVLFT